MFNFRSTICHLKGVNAFRINHTIKTIFFNYKLYYQISSNRFMPFINVEEDFCEYMRGDIRNLLLSRIYPNFFAMAHTNANHVSICAWNVFCQNFQFKYTVHIANDISPCWKISFRNHGETRIRRCYVR